MASVSFFSVCPASTTPSFVVPLSSWTSSRATTSGEARLVTRAAARRSNFACGVLGERFSTLYVATASSSSFCLRVVSRRSLLSLSVPSSVAWMV